MLIVVYTHLNSAPAIFHGFDDKTERLEWIKDRQAEGWVGHFTLYESDNIKEHELGRPRTVLPHLW